MSYHSKRYAFVAFAIVGSGALGIAANVTGIPSLYAVALLVLLAGWLAFSIMDARSAALSTDKPTPAEQNDHGRAAMASRIACRVFAVVIPVTGTMICVIAAAHSILALAAAFLFLLLAYSYYFGWWDRLVDAWDKTAAYHAK